MEEKFIKTHKHWENSKMIEETIIHMLTLFY